MPVVIVLSNKVVVGVIYDWNSLSSIWLSTSRTVLASSVSFTEKDVSKFEISCGTWSACRALRFESVRRIRTFCLRGVSYAGHHIGLD